MPSIDRYMLFAKTDGDFSEIICQCERITKGDILAAISRGARSVDGVKRRVGSGMGRCQGGFCSPRVRYHPDPRRKSRFPRHRLKTAVKTRKSRRK